MEFTLGFCGGLGMAYAVSTTQWGESEKPSKLVNWIALLFITLLLPWTNFQFAFDSEKLTRLAEGLGIEKTAPFVSTQQTIGLGILIVVAIGAAINWRWHENRSDASLLRTGSFVLFAYTLYYVVFGFIVKGFFYRDLSIANSDTLYLPILFSAGIVWFLSGRGKVEAKYSEGNKTIDTGLTALVVLVVAAVFTAAALTVTIHDGKIGFHERFPTKAETDVMPR